MYCDHCGNDIDDDSVFCQHCGKTMSTTQTPPVAQRRPKTKKEKKNKPNLWLALLFMAVLYIISYLIGEFLVAPALRKPVQEQSAPQSEIRFTIPEKQDFDIVAIPEVSEGSLHTKTFQLTGFEARFTVSYTKGTYAGAPDDTVLDLSIEIVYDASSKEAADAVTWLLDYTNSIYKLNNPNFSRRYSNSEDNYNIDLHFEDLGSPSSAELIPYAAALIGLDNYKGTILKMSDVEISLLNRGCSITHAD